MGQLYAEAIQKALTSIHRSVNRQNEAKIKFTDEQLYVKELIAGKAVEKGTLNALWRGSRPRMDHRLR